MSPAPVGDSISFHPIFDLVNEADGLRAGTTPSFFGQGWSSVQRAPPILNGTAIRSHALFHHIRTRPVRPGKTDFRRLTNLARSAERHKFVAGLGIASPSPLGFLGAAWPQPRISSSEVIKGLQVTATAG
jgi:hypothetical protein